MIIVRISGGLGNQLFQLAFYNNLKKELTNSNVMLDISFYDDQFSIFYRFFRKIRKTPSRKFMYTKQFENEIIKKDKLLKVLFIKDYKIKLVKILNYFFPLKSIFKLFNINVINEKNIEKNIENQSVVIYDGYWQNSKYIKNQELFIKTLFNFKLEAEKINNIVIHVRRGDLATSLSKNIYNVLDMNYYENAIDKIKSYGVFINEVTICSDDISWCMENIKQLRDVEIIHFSNSTSMGEDFSTMYYAKYLICSNSTFSWWAGFIGESKKMIIPGKWYSKKPFHFINDFDKIEEI
jgi:hypothetical protein